MTITKTIKRVPTLTEKCVLDCLCSSRQNYESHFVMVLFLVPLCCFGTVS
jgi:hypothetical protein